MGNAKVNYDHRVGGGFQKPLKAFSFQEMFGHSMLGLFEYSNLALILRCLSSKGKSGRVGYIGAKIQRVTYILSYFLSSRINPPFCWRRIFPFVSASIFCALSQGTPKPVQPFFSWRRLIGHGNYSSKDHTALPPLITLGRITGDHKSI